MAQVRVLIHGNDKHMAWTVGALAFAVANVYPVKPARNEQMESDYTRFEFRRGDKAAAFRDAVAACLPGRLDRIID